MSNIPGPQNQALTKSERIEGKIDRTVTGGLTLAPGGSLDFANLDQIMEVAKVVALSKCAIPAHLRDNPGACLAVCIQASEWRMSPFAVANKSYVVNDRMAYEAQILNSVILMRAPIQDQFIDYRYTGEGTSRVCTCVCTLNSGREIQHSSPEIGKIKVKNSPLWVSDPDQQLGYYTVRAMARRYFPHIILGVYTPDEMAEETMRDVTQRAAPTFTSEPDTAAVKPKSITTAEISNGRDDASVPTAATSPITSPEAPSGTGPAGGAGSGGGSEEERERLVALLNKRMDADGVSAKTVKAWAVKNAGVASESILTKDYTVEQLQIIDEAWGEISGN